MPGAVSVLALVLAAALALDRPAPAAAQGPPPAVGHVFTIVLGSEGFRSSWGRSGRPRYLARTLRRRGGLLARYHAIADAELPNYLTMISGRPPARATRDECPRFDCTHPAEVRTLADTLQAAGHSWRAYVEDLPAPCALPVAGAGDPFRRPGRRSQYLMRHNPFAYFEAVTGDRRRCRRHVVGLGPLARDLRTPARTPAFSYIVPDACHGGHVERCPNRRQAGGVDGVDAFLRRWAPRILRSPAYRRDGLLIVVFDEAGDEDSGGRVGALLLSRFVAAGSLRRTRLDHYGYLRSVEELLGLAPLGPPAATFAAAGAFQPAAARIARQTVDPSSSLALTASPASSRPASTARKAR